MSDPAAVHAIAVHRGFAGLLHWEPEGGAIVAWLIVYGLPGYQPSVLKVETTKEANTLFYCLCECEGHGLLWREDACLLYAARRLGVRPQPWAYSESEHINRLFDAIGTE